MYEAGLQRGNDGPNATNVRVGKIEWTKNRLAVKMTESWIEHTLVRGTEIRDY